MCQSVWQSVRLAVSQLRAVSLGVSQSGIRRSVWQSSQSGSQSISLAVSPSGSQSVWQSVSLAVSHSGSQSVWKSVSLASVWQSVSLEISQSGSKSVWQ